MDASSVRWDLIQAVWFDFGGVLLEIDPPLTRTALTQMLGRQEGGREVYFDIHQQEDLFLDFERGKMDAATFRDAVRQQFSASFTDAEFDDAWCALLKPVYPWAPQAVVQASKRYRTALLSNTNAIHFARFEAEARPMFNHMEQLFVSHEMDSRKPEAEIYHKALAAMQLEPLQVVFIDDNQENVLQAQAMGIQVIHLPQAEMLQGIFS